jgi:hypothetical protein
LQTARRQRPLEAVLCAPLTDTLQTAPNMSTLNPTVFFKGFHDSTQLYTSLNTDRPMFGDTFGESFGDTFGDTFGDMFGGTFGDTFPFLSGSN